MKDNKSARRFADEKEIKKPKRDSGGAKAAAPAQRQAQSTAQPEKPKKKHKGLIITIVILLVVLLIAGGGFAYYSFVLAKIDDVGELNIDDITDSSIKLSWADVEKADGYHVYYADNGSDYRPYTDTEDTQISINGLAQAEAYSFYVTAYNQFAESEGYIPLIRITTLPQKVEITAATSEVNGVIHAEWAKNPKADGYYLYCLKSGESIEDAEPIDITGAQNCTLDIPGLEPDAEYTLCVKAYLKGTRITASAAYDEKKVKVFKSVTHTAFLYDPDIDPDKPMIAFSFDDGPLDGTSGERILDVLEKYGCKATFFMVGCYTGSHASNVQRKADLNMELGNHTWDHSRYGDDVSESDIKRTSDAIHKITGKYPTAYRSPGGITSDLMLKECEREGMVAYLWSIDTEDWDSRDADKIYDKVIGKVRDGDIVLMHEIYDSTADAFERIVPELIAQGYQIVTCHDLIAVKTGSEPKPGSQYYSM